MLEMLLPEYVRQLLENYQLLYSQLASQLRWLHFDDAFRLMTRVEEGWIRLRLDGHWEFTGELLREMSWLYYSVAEMSRNLDMLKNALESVGLDRLRVTAEVSLGELNLVKVAGTALTPRDWSQDFAKLQNLDVALSTRASEATLSAVRDRLPPSLTSAGNFRVALLEDVVGLARESTLSAIKSKTDNLDVALSSRASEATLLAIKSKTDNIDVALSTRASESTLSAIAGALASRATDKLRVSVVDALPESPINITKVMGTDLTARDWSQDFARLQNIDVALSSRASESTLSAIRAQIDKLVFDTSSRLRVNAEVVANPPNLDVALSSRASESTLLAVRDRLPASLTPAGNFRVALLEETVGLAREATLSSLSGKFPSAVALADTLPNPTTTIVGSALLGFDGTNWRRVAVDTARRLRVVAESVANPPNLDVALSSRASESTLATIRDRLPSSLTTAGNFRVALLEETVGLAKETTLSALSGKFPSAASLSDTMPNPSTTVVGAALLGWDGANWRRVAVDTTRRLRVVVESVANPPNLDVALSTRASESTLSAIAGALASRATDRLRVSVVDPVPESPLNLVRVAGTALTARDWSQDFAMLQNLNITLSSLRDAVVSKLDEVGKLVPLGSTTTPLPANGLWTSPVDSDPATGRIVGSVYANQPGTLCVEQSGDGTNWDVVDCFDVSAGFGIGFSVEKVCLHARVKYTNGPTAQTVFRLYVYRRLRVL
jgi:hypothetical protein